MISVCVAAFNGEKYIEEQILSVLRNLDSQDEIIISDDGSSDRTRKIVDDLAEKDRRIRIIDGPRKGLIKNFENAIVHSKGDIIFLCDQDDVWKDNKVKTVLDIFGNTDCTLVMHDACIVDSNLRILGCSFFEFKKCKKGYWRNLIKNSYIGCCMAFKRSILDYAIPFPDNIPMHDQWIGLLSERVGKVEFCNEQLLLYRRHSNNASEMTHLPLSEMVKNRAIMLKCINKRIREKK
ncbi:MAG: glycosyltransferase family 2 protein [[Eubacterium] rectale]|nr:glycosyltransferase family 2 protein [Agathobacter rectalis]